MILSLILDTQCTSNLTYSRFSPNFSPIWNLFSPVSDEPYSRYNSSGFCVGIMLWDQTKQLPADLLKKVEETYEENFSLEVRLHLSAWIEEKFSPSVPLNMEDPEQQKAAVALANQLLVQLDARIASMPNDPDKFLMKGKLGKIAESLRVGGRACLSFLFRTCYLKMLTFYSTYISLKV